MEITRFRAINTTHRFVFSFLIVSASERESIRKYGPCLRGPPSRNDYFQWSLTAPRLEIKAIHILDGDCDDAQIDL